MITIKQTANYLLTFNNNELASAKDLNTGRFVKRSIALAEYEAEMALASQVVKTVTLTAAKILLSESIMSALTILFALSFAGLFVAFFAASSGNIYVKGFLLTVITCVSCGGIGLYLIEQFNTVKKQIQDIC